jgi:glycosyltransferase involved in cell wall biosynthesis
MTNMRKEILLIVQYPELVSPGQRFRCELYNDLLKENGFTVTTKSFFDNRSYQIIHKYGFFFTKSLAIIKGFFNRLLLFFTLNKYDYIFLQREATPIGPPIIEWLFSKIFKKKVIYDFDDAIWINLVSEQNSLATLVKNTGKIKKICKWSYKVSVGNHFLYNYALQFNRAVVYNPTCVDTDRKHNILANHDVDRITVGWTGSFSTMMYLDIVVAALSRLQKKYDFDIKIISNKKPTFNLKNVHYIEWNEQNEIVELASCQIGLMPLTHDEWSEGKCGFKLIQFLALEIPAVSSPVGVNKIIIEEGVNGYFANSDDDWYHTIEKLMLNKHLRKEMGRAGRNKIIAQYSLRSNAGNFIRLFS